MLRYHNKMVSQDYFRQLSPELFYIHANPLREGISCSVHADAVRMAGKKVQQQKQREEYCGLAAAPDSVVEGSTLSGS